MKSKLKLLENQALSRKQVGLVLLIMSFVAGVSRSAEINGTAYNGESNNGAAGVGVTLRRLDRSDPNPPQQFTGRDGKYSFKNLTSGTYRLEFKKIGYTIIVPYVQPIELDQNSSDKELVRAYSRAKNINIDRIAEFLQTRSNGDIKRLTADIQTLHESAVFDIALASSVIAKTTRRLASSRADFQALEQQVDTELMRRPGNVEFVTALRQIDRDTSIPDKQSIYAAIIAEAGLTGKVTPDKNALNAFYQTTASDDERTKLTAAANKHIKK